MILNQLFKFIGPITTLLGILTMIIPTSGSFVPSCAPAFGQEEDLGDFSIMNITTGEAETSPPSSEAPRSEAPQSEP
jgi:hypothetical protein